MYFRRWRDGITNFTHSLIPLSYACITPCAHQLGKTLTDAGGLDLPWYAYIAGAAVAAFLLKTIGDVATAAIEEMEQGVRDE